MSKLRTTYFVLLVVTFGLVSCGNSDEHKVDAKFTEYVQRFQDEATKHVVKKPANRIKYNTFFIARSI